MLPRRGARRGVVTQVDLAAMEKRYQDMLRDSLSSFHAAQQTPTAPPPTLMESQPVPDQLLVEANHLKDFRMYNPKTFDGSMDNPTKAQMWLTSIETFFRGLRLDLQGFVRAFRPTTHADALRLVVDMSLHERANVSKTTRRGCKQPGQTSDFCPQKLLETTSNQIPTSQSSHSFIYSMFVWQMCLEVESLGSILLVSTPSGEVMLSRDKIKACEVEIANHVLDVTLLVFDMQDFDVILGMDWLSANHASRGRGKSRGKLANDKKY
ncbi:histone H2B.3-like [Cucumis melo var. makuwa]|uniref:Histone H2B.3-like n=1 Tax=Cucumis melo var. makuwa TaxID=1194695 RepID=A0A5D3D5I2_CUCMM|nr:histone H2B.3-like [Cucumis melo var. makuwa]TYK18814.1 histone H2B.3-like [Cucumis melo var. makuwa]